MADQKSFDLVVLGSGPGGYVAAIRAGQLGMKVGIVERENLGGICLNWGCIPTKALLRAAEIFHLLHRLDEFGLSAKEVSFDWGKLIQRSRKVANQLQTGVKGLMKKHKIEVIDGHGRLAGRGRLTVAKDGKPVADIAAKHIILATGARARELPSVKVDGKTVWTYRDAMVPEALPKSVLVIGSGAIGIEFASFYRTMGSTVTVVEVMDRVLPVEDEEISAFARKAFEKQGMKIHTGASVTGVKVEANGATVTVDLGKGKVETIQVEKVISAVGIVGNVEDIGLETVPGIRVEKTHVVTDAFLRTGAPGIYAIGDLVGAPWLAHKAMHEAIICVETIAGLPHIHPMNVQNIPGCTYCTPQVASVGLTEAAARAAGRKINVGRFPFIGNGKAIALGESQGLVKTIFDAGTGELLGAHMVGAEVTELIQGYGIAKTLETTEAELMNTIFPHPTLSEMIHESVLDAYKRTLHI